MGSSHKTMMRKKILEALKHQPQGGNTVRNGIDMDAV